MCADGAAPPNNPNNHLPLERGELEHERVQDANKERARLHVVLVEDGLHEVEQQPHLGV